MGVAGPDGPRLFGKNFRKTQRMTIGQMRQGYGKDQHIDSNVVWRMWKVMVLTFAILAGAFFMLSGGFSFEPPAPKPRGALALATYDETPDRSITPVASAPDVTEPTPVAPTNTPPPDTRSVTGDRVNMRNGPSTDFAVLTRLNRGDQVVVLETQADSWVKLQVTASGQVGWMVERLLTPPAN